jgi:hypothetical protein
MTHTLTYAVAILLYALLIYLPGYALADVVVRRRIAGPLGVMSRFVLGFAFWIGAMFVLGAAGLQRNSILWCVVAFCGLSSVALWFYRGRRLPTLRMPAWKSWPIEEAALIDVIAIPVLILFWLALRPSIAPDSNTYHLTIPRLYVEHGGFRPIRFNVYSNWPLSFHLLFGMAMQLKDYILAKLVHFFVGVLTLVSLYLFGKGQKDRWTGLVAAALFLGNPVVLGEFPEAYVDIAFAFFFFMGFWFLTQYEGASRGNRRLLLMAGVCGGLLAGVKLFGWWAALCLGLAFFLKSARSRGVRAAARELALVFLLPCVGIALPWSVKSYVYTGNPVYPFAYGLFGGPDWSPELGAQFRTWMRSIGMGRQFTDYLLLPVRVILESGWTYDRFAGPIGRSWIVWLPLITAFGVRHRPVRAALLVAMPYCVLWAASSQQTRFLIPVLPILSVAAALSLASLLDRFSSSSSGGRVRKVCAALVVLACLEPMLSGAWQLLRPSDSSGQGTRAGLSAWSWGSDPVYEFINANLPPRARIMLLNTNHGFFCHREYVADSFFEASQMGELLRPAKTCENLRHILGAAGITHILWKDVDVGIVYPEALFAFMKDPRYARPIFQSPPSAGGHTLLELRFEKDKTGRERFSSSSNGNAVPIAYELVGEGDGRADVLLADAVGLGHALRGVPCGQCP